MFGVFACVALTLAAGCASSAPSATQSTASAATPPAPTTSSGLPAPPASSNQNPPAASVDSTVTGTDSAGVQPPPPMAEPPETVSPEPTPTPVPKRPRVEVLSAPDLAYVVDYANSGAREAALGACKDKEPDGAAISACLEKARDQFLPDVLRFKKTGSDYSLAIYKRSGSTLRELYVGGVVLTEAPDSRVKVTFTGRERGVRPLFRGRKEGWIGVPTDYSLEIEDEGLGKLTYTAKIGLVSSP
ncbi:MAG TPA: hypothetical protein VFQ61_20485 [Polyangiaceae bacterium]|nr:hypothetical protein [Polyangiaceae bacterium]